MLTEGCYLPFAQYFITLLVSLFRGFFLVFFRVLFLLSNASGLPVFIWVLAEGCFLSFTLFFFAISLVPLLVSMQCIDNAVHFAFSFVCCRDM